MSELPRQVQENIEAHRLMRPGERVLVAVSGGMDSMVLLHVLKELSAKNGWRLAIVHLNHCLRGRSSDADERLVRGTAEKLGLPVATERADVRQVARREHLSLEMAARKLRHAFLARAATQRRISCIALAHHADDQLELFFLRLLRGSGGEGLAGMKWRNASPVNPRMQLIRPLLDRTKAELQEYAVENGIPFREDASNALQDIQRNRIRHELLPLLRRKYQPAMDKTVLRAMEIIGAEADFVTQAARAWQVTRGVRHRNPAPAGHCGRLLPEEFEALPPAVQRRVVQLQLIDLGIAPDYELVERLRFFPNRAVMVGQAKATNSESVSVERDSMGKVRVGRVLRTNFDDSAQEVTLAERAGEVVFGGASIGWSFQPNRGLKRFKSTPGQEYFDAAKIGKAVVLRHWQPGDRFQPIGMAAPLKLQDFFTNEKVPRARRHQLIVGVAASGELFWVEGMRISERFKLSKGSNRRLQWRWRRR